MKPNLCTGTWHNFYQ